MSKLKCQYCGEVHSDEEWKEETKEAIKQQQNREVDDMIGVDEVKQMDKWRQKAYIFNCPECKVRNNGAEITAVENDNNG